MYVILPKYAGKYVVKQVMMNFVTSMLWNYIDFISHSIIKNLLLFLFFDRTSAHVYWDTLRQVKKYSQFRECRKVLF